MNDEFKTLKKFDAGKGREGFLHSLPALEEQGIGKISRLPVSIRIVLESVLAQLRWQKGSAQRCRDAGEMEREETGERRNSVRRRADRSAGFHRRSAGRRSRRDAQRGAALKGDPKIIEPLVPVDLVVDHSVQVDFFGSAQALRLNLDMEFKRNRERYEFLKWGQQAFKTFQLIPPGIGIVHQVNLEYLAKGVLLARKSARQRIERSNFSTPTRSSAPIRTRR